MIDKDEVYHMYRHYRHVSKWYAVNKTASLLSLDVEDVEAIIEEEEGVSDDD